MTKDTLAYAPRRAVWKHRRFWRVVVNLLVLCSLLCCATVVTLRIRSRQAMDLWSICRSPYWLDIGAPTDGLLLVFSNQPSGYRFFSYEKVDYPGPGFRDDPAEWSVEARYHPYFTGTAGSGKFNHFVLGDGVAPNFGWGIIIPDWMVIGVSAAGPLIWCLDLLVAPMRKRRLREH